jgi:hypothetical protein
VEAVENVQRLGTFLANDLEIGLPHIGADENDLRGHLVADDFEESLKGFDGSLFSHPEQARDAEIDLINERQIFVSSGVLDFIDSDGVDLAEHPVLQPVGHHMLDGIENLFP